MGTGVQVSDSGAVTNGASRATMQFDDQGGRPCKAVGIVIDINDEKQRPRN